MNKLFTSMCMFALVAGLVACNEDSTSANTSSEPFFEDGIIYKPLYKNRARTFFNDKLTEENFFTLDTKEGWWWTHTDADEGEGQSTAEFTYTDTAMIVDFNTPYDWVEYVEKPDEYWPNRTFEPTSSPYATIAFNLAPDESLVDISNWKGLCIIYESTSSFDIFPVAPSEGQWHWRVKAPKADKKALFQFEWEKLEAVSWETPPVSQEESIASVQSLNFEIGSSHTMGDVNYCYTVELDKSCGHQDVKNMIRIYKIGKYGVCGKI